MTDLVSSRSALIASRLVRAVTVLFLLFDVIGHVLRPAPVTEALARIGFPADLSVPVSLVLAFCIAMYVVSRTAVIGAILLTGYLGGAVAIQLRAESPPFEVAFPILCLIFAWGGLLLGRPASRSLIFGADVRRAPL